MKSTIRPSSRFVVSLSMLIVGLTVISYIIPDGLDQLVIWPCLIIFYAIFLHSLWRPMRIHPNIPTYIGIEVVFLTFCFLLFLLPYQMSAFGLFEHGSSRFVTNTFVDKGNQAILVSTLGVVSFYLGIRWRTPSVNMTTTSSSASEERRLILLPHVTVLALGSLVLLYFAMGWRSVGEGRYTGTGAGGVLAEGVALLILMFAMIAIALFVARLAQRRAISLTVWIGVALAGYWALRLLSFGDRNSFLLLAIVAFAGILTFRFTMRRMALLLVVVLILPAYNAIEDLRMSGTFSLVELFASSSESVDRPAESSFNLTTISVRAALQTVPEHLDYAYGFYKVYGGLGILPFFRGSLVGDSQAFLTSKDVLTYAMLPPRAGWDVGSNIICDLYLDFGILGIPVGMFLIGRFAGWMRNRVASKPDSTARIVMYLLTLALFGELPRYSADFPVRILTWAVFVLLIVPLFVPKSIFRGSNSVFMTEVRPLGLRAEVGES